MAQQKLCFQNVATADVILRLLSNTDEPLTLYLDVQVLRRSQPLTLYVHSQVLKRSPFFEAWLSERWNPDNILPLDLTLPDRKNTAACSRCIELMYAPTVKHTFFTSVRDALEVLEVAAEFIVKDCVNACFCFLEGVPWRPEDEMAIRSCLESLNVEIPVDLAARLFMSPGCKPVEIMEDRLRGMLSYSSNEDITCSKVIRKYVETQLQANVYPSVSSVFADVNKPVIYEEWYRILDVLSTREISEASELEWLLQTLKWLLETLLCLKIGVDAVRNLAQKKTAKLLAAFYDPLYTHNLLWMLTRIMRAFQNGELILERPTRLALVKTWLPIIYKLVLCTEPKSTVDNDLQEGMRALVKTWLPIIYKLVLCTEQKSTVDNDLQEGMRALTKTLPQDDQSEIFKIWFATCFEVPSGVPSRMRNSSPRLELPWPDLKEVFELSCHELRQAQQRQERGEEGQES